MENRMEWVKNRKLAITVCLLLMFLWGIVMTIIIPPWQLPDEDTHLKLIGAGIKNENLFWQLYEDMKLDNDRVYGQYEEKINMDDWKGAITKPAGYDRVQCMPKGVSLSMITHLPAALGIVLGILFHLPTFWVLELGKLFSLIFYVIVCGLALRMMPIKKEALLLVMAFPMALQQAASISYDAVLLPLCFFYIAYIFYMRYEKEELGWKEAGVTLLLLALILYIKLPYLFLGLLVCMLPKEKICLRAGRFVIDGQVIKKWRIPAGIVLLCLAAVLFYMARNHLWIKLVCGMALEPGRTKYLYTATIRTFWKYLAVSSVGQFGAGLDAPLPAGFVVGTYLLLPIFAILGEQTEHSCRMRGRTRVYVWAVFFLLAIFTMLPMVNHTIMNMLFGSEFATGTYDVREAVYQIPYIGGLQGRYFLPFLALPFLALPERGKQIDWKSWLVAVYIVIAMIFTVYVLYQRYWMG